MEQRACRGCGQPINLLRSHARTCSARCRMKVYRARRRTPVPRRMTAAYRWVRWELAPRGGRLTKRPLTVTGRAASTTRETTWTTHQAATQARAGQGVGFVLGDGIGCYDLDDAINHGRVTDWAAETIQAIPEPILYAEVSQSGRGVHIFVVAAEGPGRVIRDGTRKIERYTSGRYIAMTGAPFDLAPLPDPGSTPLDRARRAHHAAAAR